MMDVVMMLCANWWVDWMLWAGSSSSGESFMIVSVMSSDDLVDKKHQAVTKEEQQVRKRED